MALTVHVGQPRHVCRTFVLSTVLFFLLLCPMLPPCLGGPAAAHALEVAVPRVVITRVAAELKISGLPEDDQRRPFALLINGAVATQGQALPSELTSISHVFTSSGRQTVAFRYGEETGEASVFCLWGWLTILPPLVAIALALLSREVLSSLLLGVWFGGLLLNEYNPFTGLLRALDTYVVGGLADTAHASIIIFSITLGGMIGILNRIGGMQGIVEVISRMVVGPRTAQLATWIMGVLIFFDDYANTLIVGNSMRPITDRNNVSREKLSYIVDSTSAPVAGIALLSTWVGYEIGLIRESFINLNIPETNFYGVFLQTLPYRFYCILSLFFGLVICLTTKEFGPMHAAEHRAAFEGKPLGDNARPISSPEAAMPELPADMPKRWYNAAIPILFVIGGVLIGLIGHGGFFVSHQTAVTLSQASLDGSTSLIVDHVQSDLGMIIGQTNTGQDLRVWVTPETRVIQPPSAAAPTATPPVSSALDLVGGLKSGMAVHIIGGGTDMPFALRLRAAFADADSTKVLVWISVLGSILAMLLGMSQGLITLEQGAQGWMNGARAMVMAMVVLVLAWSINGVCKDLHTADFIVEMVKGVLNPWLVPTIIFLVACFISFATGTSWGTMAILLPISIPLAYQLNLDAFRANPAAYAGWTELEFVRAMMLVSIGAVLEGSIFGDHCSPISDTTIMSSMASGSDHIDHVRTQAPYALSVAAFSILFCYIPAGLGVNPFMLLPIAAIALFLLLQIVGKPVSMATAAVPPG